MRLPWLDQHPVRGTVAYGPEWPTISSSLTEREAAWLNQAAHMKRVLEVGTAYGFSTICLAETASFVVTVDPHDTHASLDAMRSYLRIYGVEHKVLVVVARSDVALPEFDAESFDLAFIDGDHTGPGLTYDISQARRLVRPGGQIAIHDYGEDTCPDVAPTIERLVSMNMLPAGAVATDTLYVAQV